ncbi:2,3-bisphosphoglycerate-independent phosphoglycerate mutase [Wenxinia saemankumensis]|uniref:2,3-bisphosphoglycerate-independent phosphoglycerate mutase n=1 Tax=Wenxinia saemankumensis TaxID=1447782 RepID=A0A1M6E013_9RHOB|nr:2,3-bisphosphoglycerate-independent phosphoglycerate mutase [Wenxinia saemankumensis]SHI78608.1 phosphoglycerate mutase [Wenxinia saemankumensis]
MSRSGPVILCILDGWGLRDDTANNAPALAKTPAYDRIMASCPHATLVTYGPDVGLPEGQMGNSEVGHTNIGAGRVVLMDLLQIDKVVRDDALGDQAALAGFVDTLKGTGGTAHLMGLVSDGGVHSQLHHMIAAARTIAAAGVPVAIHAITDGRDVAPRSAEEYLDTLAEGLPDVPVATVSGRYYAMDRDNRWNRVERAYRAMALGQGDHAAPDAKAALAAAYARDQSDEFVEPTVIGDYAGMKAGDGIFMLNFRADRAREILAAMGDPDFDGFDRGARPDLAARLGMVDYSTEHDRYMTTVFPKQKIVNTLGEWVAARGLRQFRLAETEKYPHVTFFLNGGREEVFAGEDRAMPKSPDVATYDLQPEMSAPEVTEKLVGAIRGGYDLIVVNFANPDMVGHTGDLDAAIAACEAVDKGLAAALEALEGTGGAMVMIADHGNCETMVDPETGKPHTAHTTNLVPVAVWGGPEGAHLRDGKLADVAPTVLELMGLDQPEEMTGRSLIGA